MDDNIKNTILSENDKNDNHEVETKPDKSSQLPSLAVVPILAIAP